MRGRLIIIEGLCGTGKTTVGRNIAADLSAMGFFARFFDEGAPDHPVSLNGYAFLRRDEYQKIIDLYPDEAAEMKNSALFSSGSAILPYKNERGYIKNAKIASYLQSRELCWTKAPVASINEYMDANKCSWRRFADNCESENDIIVIEGVFLQHTIHDLRRLYSASEGQIAEYISEISCIIKKLSPVLFYLFQENVPSLDSVQQGFKLPDPHLNFVAAPCNRYTMPAGLRRV